MKKQALVVALVAGAFAGCVGVKQIGYVGASSGTRPNALKRSAEAFISAPKSSPAVTSAPSRDGAAWE